MLSSLLRLKKEQFTSQEKTKEKCRNDIRLEEQQKIDEDLEPSTNWHPSVWHSGR